MPPPPNHLSLKGRALRHLSTREHSRAELARKLAPHAEHEDEIEPLLDELEAKGFLSDARFVESVVHRRAAKVGLSRLKQELQAKGIDAHKVQEALQQLQPSELERARAVWSRRFGQPASDPREQARQIRFLLARGFASEVVRRVVKTAAADPEP